ncbi:NUDIX hydrolase [Sinosporangium siamense]|uniref:Nudix hydrolase domain-containing protein n=1 Tax=Sinosporangium siamense TaxID=1367973 RepID=A0A919RH28_9ACTN|nr:NUDIX hydrolase [Sinosporangium siamense]GII93718.1 hypothetical protein Ssi02_39490 [Sinosporangium siamense]
MSPQPPAVPTLVPSVRALVLDGDRLLLFRRTVPGKPVYWSIPGGHVEPEDATLEHTLHREVLEELGATVEDATPLAVLSCPRPDGVKIQHVYGCRLVTLDPGLRCGPEFTDPSRGLYELVRLPLESGEVAALDLVPPELSDYLARHIATLPDLIGRSAVSR